MVLTGSIEIPNDNDNISIVEYLPKYINLEGSITLHRNYNLTTLDKNNLTTIKNLNINIIPNGGVL